jgi:hypothetical protein
MSAPADWDGLSYCVQPACRRPATHRVLLTFTTADAVPVVELVCCEHAQVVEVLP